MWKKLLLLSLSELSLGIGVFAKEASNLVFVGQLFCFAFAIVAAESDRCTLELDSAIRLDGSAGEWASLLFHLLRGYQLVISLGSETLFVSIKLLLAATTAEVDLAIFPIAGLVFLGSSAGNQTLQRFEINLRIHCNADGCECCDKSNQTQNPSVLHLHKLASIKMDTENDNHRIFQ